MRSKLGLVVSTLALAACGAPPDPGLARSTHANFVNGTFETGAISGPEWIITRARWGNGNGNVGFGAFPPRTVANLNLTQNVGSALTVIAPAGVPTQLTAADSLRMPFSGANAARVNGPIGTQGDRNANILTQEMVTTVADVDATDGKIHVRFAAAPVLNAPTHNPTQQPYFFILIENVTKNVTLYDTFNFSNQPGVLWKTAATSINGDPTAYTDWEAFDIAPGASGIGIGDTIRATIVASGCSFTAHFGQVFVDEFGSSFPFPNVSVKAPNFVPANTTLTYTVTAKNNGTGSATGVIVDIQTPPMTDSNLGGAPRTVNTTYVSTNAPGATCTNPTVGQTGTVSCNIGNLGPGESYTFTVTVQVPTVPGTHTAPNFVNQGLYSIRTDQRPTPLGGGLVQTQVSTSSLVGLQTTLTDGVSSVVWGKTNHQYTLSITNFGPNAANNFTVVDARPAQLTAATWTCAGSGGGTCGAANGAGNINTTASLPVGATVTYTITTTVTGGPANGAFTYTATATPTGGQVQSVLFNNVGTDTDTASAALFALTVSKHASGNGTGTVVSVPSGISCGASCTVDLAGGTDVALTAIPTAGSVFTGWSGGACAGLTNPCVLTISAATNVVARFDQPVLVTGLTTTSNAGSQDVRPGDTATYSVKLQIPAGATGAPIKVSDVFPTGLAFSSSTTPTTTGAVTCSPNACTAPTIVTGATTTWDFGAVTCTTAGPCEIDFSVVARVAPTTTRGDTLTNSIGATLMGTQAQPTLTVIEPNLTVSRSPSPANGLLRGSPVTITVTLANDTGGANSDAYDTVVVFPIPANYTGGGYAAGTCPGAVASFNGGNATFTLPTGNAGAIAFGTSCTFTYQLTGSANATGNTAQSFPAGTVTSKSVTGANPPAKLYTTNPPAIVVNTAPIANGGNCAAPAECVSVICDTDGKCGYDDGNGPCTSGDAGVVCRSGLCSQNGLCAPAGGCLVDGDCNTATHFCNTQTQLCTPRLPNDQPVPTISGHAPPLTGTCTEAVGAIVCESSVCDTTDDKCGYDVGNGPCSTGTVCRSGLCSVTSVCAPAGGCLADGDCNTATEFCNTVTRACVERIPNGGPVPTIGGHAPPLTGTCATDVASAVCQSSVCDTRDDLCGYGNGGGSCDSGTAPVVCRSAVCGTDGLCGFPDGQGPCTAGNATTVCRGGACTTEGVCATRCTVDTDCDQTLQFCNTESQYCTPKLENGHAVPTVAGHDPTLDGTCNEAAAKVACLAGVCDPKDNLCGFADESGTCTPATAPTVCRSGACGEAGQCAPPGGVVYAFTGGGLSCSMSTTGRGADLLAIGLALAALAYLRARKRAA